MSLFRSRIMFIISFNLFFQWFVELFFSLLFFSIGFLVSFRLVQNLVFYGVSQNTGSWKLNPYLAFTVSAFVELLAYIVVHLILDRIGRKIPYCFFALVFGLVALSIVPVQKYMTKNSQSKNLCSLKSICSTFFVFSSNDSDEYYQWCIEISRFGIVRDYLHLRQ